MSPDMPAKLERHLRFPAPDYSFKGEKTILGLGIHNPKASSVMRPLFDLGLVHAVITKRHDYSTAHRRREERHRFIVLLDGRMTLELNGETHNITPGDLVFFPAGTVLFQSNPGNSLFLYMTFMEHPFWAPLTDRGCHIRPYESADLLYLLMMRIAVAVEDSTALALRFAARDALTLTDLLQREVIMASHKPVKERTSLRQLVKEIRKAPERNWTLAAMADQANVSTRTLIRHLSAEYGLSPIEMVVRERMGRAHNLLAETDMTIAAIAEAVGYESASSFSHLFKKHFGKSPGKRRTDIKNAI